MRVAEAVGRALAALGVDAVFGLLGSGNLTVTNALRDAGVPFYAARHEGGAICMTDGYARVSGRLAACSVHQGPGLTNAITGLTEAAKSRTPLLVLAADVPAAALRSNFRIDQAGLVEAVGAVAERVHGPATAMADVARAVRRARIERRAVVLMLPLDVQAAECDPSLPPPLPPLAPPQPGSIDTLASFLADAERPAIIAGRGAVLAGAGPALRRLGELTGAVLATSAVANGLFAGDPFAVGIAGGFSSPLAARLLGEADAVVAFGAALNQWTTRHGTLIGPDARVAQVDLDADALGAHRPIELGVIGDARATAEALVAALDARSSRRAASASTVAARDSRAPAAAPRRSPPRSRPAAGATSRTTTARLPAGSTRARSRSRSTTCCRSSAPWWSTPATSWAGRRCTCASRTPPASCSRRRSSASASRSATRSAPRSRGPTGSPSPRSATAAR